MDCAAGDSIARVHTDAAHLKDTILFAGPWVAAGIYFIATRRIPWKGGRGAATGRDAVAGGVVIILIGVFAAYMILTH